MKIRYITPYSLSKQFNAGDEYNKVIAELPDDCWVCLRDGDTMFLTPDWGRRIASIIEANPEYALITCMTNRIGIPAIATEGMFDIDSIAEHITKAKEVKGTQVIPTNVAPGMFMLFHKSTWSKVGGFTGNPTAFDSVFSAKVKAKGLKIGAATGLYILHLYRYGQPNPKTSIQHLLNS